MRGWKKITLMRVNKNDRKENKKNKRYERKRRTRLYL